ncbi:hypothetical protein [Paraburkholderia susongensis]|uniref:Uncharacterized protein n=1 Tax=Paraburkholderia susongensis TaxID=1515439 RepID=A0A1X7I6U9_9BURK|nr:hypothetical protein [Paraburkholderia susongensis]SMG09835.1 hypothetical protein SAMN06265784_101351 [Paraburkholderia susongensis]
MTTERCPGCGHTYYDDVPERNGYCSWCVSEGVWDEQTAAARGPAPFPMMIFRTAELDVLQIGLSELIRIGKVYDSARTTVMDARRLYGERYVLLEQRFSAERMPLWSESIWGPKPFVLPDGKTVATATTTLSTENVDNPVQSLSAAERAVLAERRRQVSEEGCTLEHDDRHQDGEMALAAACYAAADTESYPPAEPPDMWPWDVEWWKPTTPRHNLVKAAALIIAEIERIDRAAPASPAGDQGEVG